MKWNFHVLSPSSINLPHGLLLQLCFGYYCTPVISFELSNFPEVDETQRIGTSSFPTPFRDRLKSQFQSNQVKHDASFNQFKLYCHTSLKVGTKVAHFCLNKANFREILAYFRISLSSTFFPSKNFLSKANFFVVGHKNEEIGKEIRFCLNNLTFKALLTIFKHEQTWQTLKKLNYLTEIQKNFPKKCRLTKKLIHQIFFLKW